jgi:hypothetical protein
MGPTTRVSSASIIARQRTEVRAALLALSSLNRATRSTSGPGSSEGIDSTFSADTAPAAHHGADDRGHEVQVRQGQREISSPGRRSLRPPQRRPSLKLFVVDRPRLALCAKGSGDVSFAHVSLRMSCDVQTTDRMTPRRLRCSYAAAYGTLVRLAYEAREKPKIR